MGRVVSRLLLGFVVIAFGILMLLDNLGYIAFWEVIGIYWPLILVVIGMNYAFRRLWLSAFFFSVIGGVLIALNLDLIDGSLWTYIIPIGIISVGLGILLPTTAKRSKANQDNYYQDQRPKMNIIAILGGTVKKVTSQSFESGDILAVFGGATLDLRAAQLAPKGGQIEVTAIFGGIDVIAPPEWQVETHVSTIFGGVDDRRNIITPTAEYDKRLVIRGVCLFGGIDIKN
ncbi:MAG: LiaF transmembrane domain-containing protein [Culicoidibacterales bacterium]